MDYKMTYEWEEVFLKQSENKRTIGIFKSFAEPFEVMAILSFTPISIYYPKEKHVEAVVFIKGDQKNLTDGKFNWIHHDLEEIIKDKSKNIYPENLLEIPYDFYSTNVFFVQELPVLDYFTHGDFSIAHDK